MGADVVGARRLGQAAHAAVALGTGDPAAQRVEVAAGWLGGVIGNAAAPAAHLLRGFPQFHAGQCGVLVAVGGPGPVLARHLADFPHAGGAGDTPHANGVAARKVQQEVVRVSEPGVRHVRREAFCPVHPGEVFRRGILG